MRLVIGSIPIVRIVTKNKNLRSVLLMAVENFICETCLCANVCDVKKVLLKFHPEAKKQLPADIEMLNCGDYLKVKEE